MAKEFKKGSGGFLLKILPVCFSILGTHAVYAASFDCAKAGKKVEKIICSDEKLSDMDDSLNSLYREYLNGAANPELLKNEQRTWISKRRNNCGDVRCLREAYADRIADLKKINDGPVCNIHDVQLIGGWRRVKSGDFEEFAFEINDGKHEFVSWLHHRPEFVGNWELKGCRLHIEDPQNEELDFDYQVLEAGKILKLKSLESGALSSYKKTRN